MGFILQIKKVKIYLKKSCTNQSGEHPYTFIYITNYRRIRVNTSPNITGSYKHKGQPIGCPLTQKKFGNIASLTLANDFAKVRFFTKFGVK